MVPTREAQVNSELLAKTTLNFGTLVVFSRNIFVPFRVLLCSILLILDILLIFIFLVLSYMVIKF